MMKGTPCSRGNYAPLKTSSKTRISRSRGSAPGGVWGSAPTLLAAVNGSRAGYNSPAAPIPRSGFVLGSIAVPVDEKAVPFFKAGKELRGRLNHIWVKRRT